MAEIYLNDIAHGRSGDKGDTSNVCVAARTTVAAIGKEFRQKDIGEQPGGMLETEQDSIDHADIDTPFPKRLVTEPVNINHDK